MKSNINVMLCIRLFSEARSSRTQLVEKRAASVVMTGKEVSFRFPSGSTHMEVFNPSQSVKVSYHEHITKIFHSIVKHNIYIHSIMSGQGFIQGEGGWGWKFPPPPARVPYPRNRKI